MTDAALLAVAVLTLLPATATLLVALGVRRAAQATQALAEETRRLAASAEQALREASTLIAHMEADRVREAANAPRTSTIASVAAGEPSVVLAAHHATMRGVLIPGRFVLRNDGPATAFNVRLEWRYRARAGVEVAGNLGPGEQATVEAWGHREPSGETRLNGLDGLDLEEMAALVTVRGERHGDVWRVTGEGVDGPRPAWTGRLR